MVLETIIGIAIGAILIVLVAFTLARMHIDVNNLMTITSHLIDRPPVWRWGKPPTARNRRKARNRK